MQCLFNNPCLLIIECYFRSDIYIYFHSYQKNKYVKVYYQKFGFCLQKLTIVRLFLWDYSRCLVYFYSNRKRKTNVKKLIVNHAIFSKTFSNYFKSKTFS